MAVTVNARDLILQSVSPRVATVSMSPNIVVSQDQVTGLGLVVLGTKMVFLNATTQVFQIAKTGVVSPSSTVLTAALKNIVATPSLTVVTGTISPTPTLVDGTATINYTSMLTDTALIRLSATQDGVTYADEITLVKVREGIDGLIGFITNEAHMVAADYLGNVLAYTDAGGNFKVFQGINDISSLCTFSIPSGGNTSGLTASINTTTGVYAVIGGYPVSTDIATITFRATFGAVNIDKVFTLSKSKAAVPGKRGSRTFYVPLTGATNTFSDTLATTASTVDGGPIMNDVVTQYNTSMGFALTKFYQVLPNGSTSWVVVNAVVDGNLLVSGTVGANHLQAKTITAASGLIADLAVDTLQIAGNAITVPMSTAGGAGTSYNAGEFNPNVFASGFQYLGTGTQITVIVTVRAIGYDTGTNCLVWALLRLSGGGTTTIFVSDASLQVGSTTVMTFSGNIVTPSTGWWSIEMGLGNNWTTGGWNCRDCVVTAFASKR